LANHINKSRLCICFIILISLQTLHAQTYRPKKNYIGLHTGVLSSSIKDELASPLTYKGSGAPMQLSYRFMGNKNRHSVSLSYSKSKLYPAADLPYGHYAYEACRDYPANFDLDIIRRNYLTSGYTTAGRGIFTYGKLTDKIGYIHISSFSGSEETFLEINGILEDFQNLNGLVIDVRHNGGGSINNSDLIASRFAVQKKLYAYVKWRNGPEHDDFTEPQELTIEPSEEWRFSKPVALLTNRSVFSSAEDFVLAMRVFPHVTVIGDITGGGAGNPILRELPNGWVYRLSRWQELTPEMENYEGIGLMPDVLVGILEEDLAAGRDTILETAITTLEFFFD
jgi:hypothetical protein